MWLTCASWLLLCPAALAQSQKQRTCGDETSCQDGAYCDLDANVCRKCLSCDDFKRKPPETPSACIKSITECGSCVEGDMGCSGQSTSYIWIAVLVALVILALVIFVVVYYGVRNLRTLKIRASASASVQQHRGQYAATSPESPPPYAPPHAPPHAPPYAPPNAPPYAPPYTPPNAHANAPPEAYDSDYTPRDDSIRPFIRRDSKVRIPGAMESDGNQEAVAYTPPSYVRQARPNSLEPSSASEHLPESSPQSVDTRDSNDNAVGVTEPATSASGPPLAVSDASASRLVQPFHQDSNNNGAAGGGCAPSTAPAPSAHASPSVVINFVQSINMQQNNQL